MARPDIEGMKNATRALLEATGLDPQDADLVHTPRRVAELWQREFLSGYEMDPLEILGDPVVGEPDPEVVVTRGLAFHALCPHHLLPFQGVAQVAYVPRGKLVGFGRLAKLVACFTQRLTLQERATHQIAAALVDHLDARGAACVLEARQLCLGIPADRHADNRVVTTSFVGEPEARGELRRLLAE